MYYIQSYPKRSAAGVLPHNLSKQPILMPKIKDWHSRLRVHTLRLGLNGETDSSYRVSVFLLNGIFLLFRRVFLGSTIHSKEESMNEYVAGFSFGGKHDIESVTGAAGLYQDRAVWIFPVPEIPERKHERMCSRCFSLSERT